MYAQLRESLSAAPRPAGSAPRLLLSDGVGRNVVYLGLTSLFTDISSEMISTVLPLYLLFHLRLSPLEFGFVDGLYQGASAPVRIFGGYLADRWQRYKEVAGLGYLLSALCKPLMLLAGPAWMVLAGLVLVDRTGKGIRTAPRDALISLSSPPTSLGLAFGVHRALDTCGAMIGPLVAFGILSLLPTAFDVVFVVSLGAAVIGLGVLGLFVENRAPRAAVGGHTEPISWRVAAGLMRSPGFNLLVVAGSALALATASDAFVYLAMQHRLTFTASSMPLLYVGTSLVYLLLAIPAGRLADRVGRGRVFFCGYLLLLVVYVLLLLPSLGTAEVMCGLLLFGAYYAATDGILMALASELLAPELRTSGMALLTTATGLARLAASLVFGALWAWRGVDTSMAVFSGGLVAALIVAGVAMVRRHRLTMLNRYASDATPA